MEEVNILLDRIGKFKSVLIYGAQVIAVGVYSAFKGFGINTESFVVSSHNGNPKTIENIPVKVLADIKTDNQDTIFLIAVSESLHAEIAHTLEEAGYKNLICVDSHLEYVLMSEYYRKLKHFPLMEDTAVIKDKTVDPVNELKVYMVKSHFDKPLKNQYNIPNWVIPIQAGAALTEQNIAAVSDNTGFNISEKNRNYCELTATYWVWKNVRSKYKGIFHYRRMLGFDEKSIQGLFDGLYDVVLPLPYLSYPTTEEQWRRFVPPDAWQAVEIAIKELTPEYYEPFRKIINGQYIYNYNMLVAREDIFDEYCSWLFGILERAEKLSNPENGLRVDRAMAYSGEVLSSLFFLYHEKDMKIAHAEKIWMV